MGVGVSLLVDARSKHGWSTGRISRFLITRGLLLVLVSFFIELPAWVISLISSRAPSLIGPEAVIPGDGPPRFVFTVLVGLGLSMVLSSLFVRARTIVWAGLAVTALAASVVLTPGPEGLLIPHGFLTRLLLIPGLTHHVWVQYPVVPWFGITALGVLFGRWIVHDRVTAFATLPWIGAGALVMAIVLRALGGFGNIRPPRDTSWIEFLNFIKYPPAVVFTLFTLGVNALVLSLMDRIQERAARMWRWLQVFGQAPMAFYLMHLWLYAVIGAAAFRQGTGYLMVYAVWMASVWPLFVVTRRYRDFKQTQAVESYWRML
jgi:uncharacterized membrane protein